jgi:hypothetical protein
VLFRFIAYCRNTHVIFAAFPKVGNLRYGWLVTVSVWEVTTHTPGLTRAAGLPSSDSTPSILARCNPWTRTSRTRPGADSLTGHVAPLGLFGLVLAPPLTNTARAGPPASRCIRFAQEVAVILRQSVHWTLATIRVSCKPARPGNESLNTQHTPSFHLVRLVPWVPAATCSPLPPVRITSSDGDFCT